jgi:hypothetical protein
LLKPASVTPTLAYRDRAMDGWVAGGKLAVSIDMDTPDGLRRALVDILQVTPLTREISFPCPSLTRGSTHHTRVDRLTHTRSAGWRDGDSGAETAAAHSGQTPRRQEGPGEALAWVKRYTAEGL